MKIVVTGSLGNISKPLTEALVQKGHEIIVVSSNNEKQKDIEALGAVAAIGSLENADFLANTFAGADAVYTMVPPNNYFDPNLNLIAYYEKLGHNYAQAIKKSNIKRVVNLSSIGAHLNKNNGILLGAHNVEGILNELSSEVAITHIRPTAFYYNLYGYADMIKSEGVIAANYGAERSIPWVSPKDIATAVAEELTTPLIGRKTRYVVSEELTGDETAKIIGAAIGKPNLKWKLIPDKDALNGLIAIGMNPKVAAGLVEMYASLYNGKLLEDFYRNKPAVMGKVKMADFAKEFAASLS
ncbi:NAD(P)H-binding protein [Flavobacterium sp. LaA7.5]|nr:NAD(P)H-binding protein [Flavobacterium salilacus subsp. altitudinum]